MLKEYKLYINLSDVQDGSGLILLWRVWSMNYSTTLTSRTWSTQNAETSMWLPACRLTGPAKCNRAIINVILYHTSVHTYMLITGLASFCSHMLSAHPSWSGKVTGKQESEMWAEYRSQRGFNQNPSGLIGFAQKWVYFSEHRATVSCGEMWSCRGLPASIQITPISKVRLRSKHISAVTDLIC